MQIRLQQPHDIQLHIAYQVAHPTLTIVPLIVHPKMHRPDPGIDDARTVVEGARRRCGEVVQRGERGEYRERGEEVLGVAGDVGRWEREGREGG